MTLTYDELTLGPDAYSLAPGHGGGPAYTRVYRAYGRRAHLKESACPYLAGGPELYGTGCQREYERAAVLPLCRLCFTWRECCLADPRLGTAHDHELA